MGYDGDLVDKGIFTMNKVEHTGVPDTLTLRARSADLRSGLSAQRDRDAYNGVRAKYRDIGEGRTDDVIAGTDDGKGVKTLRYTYATKSNAMRAVRSEYQCMKWGVVSFSIDLARGRADIYPEQHATVSGFKRDIVFATALTLECKPLGVDKAPESDNTD